MKKGTKVSNQQEPPQYLSKNPFYLAGTLVHNPVCYKDEFYGSNYGHDEFPQRQSQWGSNLLGEGTEQLEFGDIFI